MIRLRLFSSLREIAGAKEVEVDGEVATIRDALARFSGQHGEKAKAILFDKQGDVWASVLLLVNGQAAEEGPATRLKPGDVVSVLLPTAGG